MEHESDGDTECDRCTWNNPPKIGKGTERLKRQRTRRQQHCLNRSEY